MMDLEHGSSVLGQMGITAFPVGTLEELRKKGLDPKNVASCHPSTPGEVRGCPLWNECRFHQRKMGGFKSQGPRYIGYLLATDEDSRKEDYCTCHVFVRTLQARMDTGMLQRTQGRKGEFIRVIAQEGDEIVRRVLVPVNKDDRAPNAPFHWVTERVKVPKHPRPGEPELLGYDLEILEREKRRQEAEQEAEDLAYDTHRDQMRKEAKVVAHPVETLKK